MFSQDPTSTNIINWLDTKPAKQKRLDTKLSLETSPTSHSSSKNNRCRITLPHKTPCGILLAWTRANEWTLGGAAPLPLTKTSSIKMAVTWTTAISMWTFADLFANSELLVNVSHNGSQPFWNRHQPVKVSAKMSPNPSFSLHVAEHIQLLLNRFTPDPAKYQYPEKECPWLQSLAHKWCNFHINLYLIQQGPLTYVAWRPNTDFKKGSEKFHGYPCLAAQTAEILISSSSIWHETVQTILNLQSINRIGHMPMMNYRIW